MSLKDFINENEFYIYDNENFQKFLKSIKFSFDVPFIHVTGTAGKTFICNCLANIYEANNYKVGLITSDMMNDFYKDVQNEKYSGIAGIFDKYEKEIEKYNLTIYELLLFTKLYEFKNSNVDLAVIECFMGGEFDPSNIDEDPALVIFNNAGLEHCDDLGKSESEVALTKCGIIKRKSLAIYNTTNEDIIYVLNEVARKNKAKLIKVAEFYDYNIEKDGRLTIGYHPFPSFKVNTTALYNRENVACVLEALIQLQDKFPVKNEDIQKGLLMNLGYGYFDVMTKNGKLVIFDKANNFFSLEKMCKTLTYQLQEEITKTGVIFAVDINKNIEKMLATLAHNTRKITLTTYDDENARKEDGYMLFVEDYKYFENYLDALEELANSDDVHTILVTGDNKFIKQIETSLGLIK